MIRAAGRFGNCRQCPFIDAASKATAASAKLTKAAPAAPKKVTLELVAAIHSR